MSPEGYAATGGSACPVCGGTDLAYEAGLPHNHQVVLRRAGCENCGAWWMAVYELTGYESLHRPEKPTDA